MRRKPRWRRKQFAALGLAALTACVVSGFYVLGMVTEQRRDTAVAAVRQAEALAKAKETMAARNVGAESVAKELRPGLASAMGGMVGSEDATTAGVVEEIAAALDADETWKWFQHLEKPLSEFTEAEWTRLGDFLNARQDLVEQIRALAKRGQPWYEIDPSQEWRTVSTHRPPLRDFGRLLWAQAAWEAHGGNTTAALANVEAIYKLGDILEEEPILLSQYTRMGLHGIGQSAIIEALPPGSLGIGEWSQIEAILGEIDYRTNASRTLSVEAEANLGIIEHYRERLGSVPDFDEDMVLSVFFSPLGRPWVNMDECAYASTMQEIVVLTELPYYEAAPSLEAITERIDDLPVTRVFTHIFTLSIAEIAASVARFEALNELALAGLQVELYHAQQGQYPETLDVLERTVPVDPFTGHPYVYTHTPEGFTLYSVGEDRVDDGGWHDFRDGDIVWRGVQAPRE